MGALRQNGSGNIVDHDEELYESIIEEEINVQQETPQ